MFVCRRSSLRYFRPISYINNVYTLSTKHNIINTALNTSSTTVHKNSPFYNQQHSFCTNNVKISAPIKNNESVIKKIAKKTFNGLCIVFKKLGEWMLFLGKCTVAAIRDPSVMKKWKVDFIDSCKHFCTWVKTGFILFVKNIKISLRLIMRILKGKRLTRSERKVLMRTSTDTLKLVPFSLFLIIPFAELALPIFLRLFPNMLPSTFATSSSREGETYTLKKIKVKQQMAHFFQQVIENKNKEILKQVASSVDSTEKREKLENILQRITQGNNVNNDSADYFPSSEDLLLLAKVFKKEFQIEKMSIEQLHAICKMLGITTYGFKSHVILQLRHYVNRLRSEDREILWDGVNSLEHDELVEFCRSRGIRYYGVSDEFMRASLSNWLELSSNREIPTLLLLWTRTFFMLADERQVLSQLGVVSEDTTETVEEKISENLDLKSKHTTDESSSDISSEIHDRAEARKMRAEQRIQELEDLLQVEKSILSEEDVKNETSSIENKSEVLNESSGIDTKKTEFEEEEEDDVKLPDRDEYDLKISDLHAQINLYEEIIDCQNNLLLKVFENLENKEVCSQKEMTLLYPLKSELETIQTLIDKKYEDIEDIDEDTAIESTDGEKKVAARKLRKQGKSTLA